MTRTLLNSARLGAGDPSRLGAVARDGGVNFAVFSENATKIDICLFSDDGARETTRIALPERTGAVWHGFVEGLGAGAVYGLRAHGPYAPDQGHRFNPNKLLLDPYARATVGGWTQHDALFGYRAGDLAGDLSFCDRDNAPYAPKAVIVAEAPAPAHRRPQTSWRDTVIYEAHVKGLTRRAPEVPQSLRGRYEGVAAPAMIDHLLKIGVTAVELLPVQAFFSEPFLAARGLSNYWGYNTFSFFLPDPKYGDAAGFRRMVDALHDAGLEVILDVVYNHTAESDQLGPTLSFRGLDNASYYRLAPGRQRFYLNDAGTGNTLNLSHPFVLRLALDSLRYWVEQMGVDGFRFDLATTLAREAGGFDPNGGFLDALRQDPVLSGVKLIAEPWDIGPDGYRLGAFPPPFAEWNDRFRDTARRFWRRDAHSAQEIAARMLGSADYFDRAGRRAWSSVNYVAAHDGFTLADVAAYADKHNEANGEQNRDGHNSNFSDNCGVEGPTDDAEILGRRKQRVRNLLATLFMSQGTPMLLAGDEFGQSQGGNNNAYCQDNETSWLDWARKDDALIAFVAALTNFRRRHPALRQPDFVHANRRGDGALDVEWLGLSGGAVNWRDPGLDRFALIIRIAAEAPTFAQGDDAVFIAVNGSALDAAVALPPGAWRRAIDTSGDDAVATDLVRAHSIAAFELV